MEFGAEWLQFVKAKGSNWRKLLMLSALKLIAKIEPLYQREEQRLLIIDDTVEPKRGRQIEGSCRTIYSNKERRTIEGLNIVSLNYSDRHSTFQLDFSLRMNNSRRKEITDFSRVMYHRSNAYQRRKEGLSGKNIVAIEMVERALNAGITADYLLVDSWYAKPNFIYHRMSIETKKPMWKISSRYSVPESGD